MKTEIAIFFLQFLPDVVQVDGSDLPDELLYGRAGIKRLSNLCFKTVS
jgi:hypothetical protein